MGQGWIGGLDAVRRVALLHLDDDDDDDDDKDGQEDATQDDLHLKVLAPIPGRNTNEQIRFLLSCLKVRIQNKEKFGKKVCR